MEKENNKFEQSRYAEYLADIEIAKKEISSALLYPNEEVLYDLYAIPSHNHSTFYAAIYSNNGKAEMVYARNEINSVYSETPIKMYSFKKALDAKKKDHGKIIVGIVPIDHDFCSFLKEVDLNTQDYILSGHEGLTIDGVFQALRFYSGGTVSKTLAYYSADRLNLPQTRTDLIYGMENLYLKVEKYIDGI